MLLSSFILDWETSEEDGSTEEDEDENADVPAATPQESLEASVLSESDGESEKCPICLARIADQDIGTPESCDHDFCLECIVEWSKVKKCFVNLN